VSFWVARAKGSVEGISKDCCDVIYEMPLERPKGLLCMQVRE